MQCELHTRSLSEAGANRSRQILVSQIPQVVFSVVKLFSVLPLPSAPEGRGADGVDAMA
jgi:hypothetical protein